jgi:hypothetical protein
MKLAVLGATASVGREFVTEAADAGHEVTTLVREQRATTVGLRAVRSMSPAAVIPNGSTRTERPFDGPRSYLVVSAREPLAAAAAAAAWPDGPPDLCITSPSDDARDTAAFVAAGRYVTTMNEPLLARRRPTESPDDFRDRFAMGLRIVSVYDTRASLVVCDELPDRQPTPFVLDGKSILRCATLLESEAPLP